MEFKRAENPPALPFFKLHLQDLVELENENRTGNNRKSIDYERVDDPSGEIFINMKMRMKMFSIIKKLQQFQQNSFPFQINQYVRQYLR